MNIEDLKKKIKKATSNKKTNFQNRGNAFGPTKKFQLTLVQQHCLITVLQDLSAVVGHQQDRRSVFLQILKVLEAFALEELVAYR